MESIWSGWSKRFDRVVRGMGAMAVSGWHGVAVGVCAGGVTGGLCGLPFYVFGAIPGALIGGVVGAVVGLPTGVLGGIFKTHRGWQCAGAIVPAAIGGALFFPRLSHERSDWFVLMLCLLLPALVGFAAGNVVGRNLANQDTAFYQKWSERLERYDYDELTACERMGSALFLAGTLVGMWQLCAFFGQVLR